MYPHKFGINRTSLIPVKYFIYSYKCVRAKKISKHSTLIISFLLLINSKMINMHIHACTHLNFKVLCLENIKISNRLSIKNNENENLSEFFIHYRSSNSMNFIHIINIIIIIIIITTIIIIIIIIVIIIIIIMIIIIIIVILIIIIIILLFNFYIWNLIK